MRKAQTRAIALDILNVSDRVWHDGFLYNFRVYAVYDQSFDLFKSFLTNLALKFVLDGQSSKSVCINAVVLQGSIFGPILVLIFINDLQDGINSRHGIYADGTTI